MDASLNPSVRLADLFGLWSLDKTPKAQPVLTEDDCSHYAVRVALLNEESNNHLNIFQPTKINFCNKLKVFTCGYKNPHTQLVFDPFTMFAKTGKDFVFLSRFCDYLVFCDAVPYPPHVPHQSAILHFLNYFSIVPDYTVACPFGLSRIDESISRLESKLNLSRYEVEDCHPRSKIKKILNEEIKILACEIEKLKHVLALSKIV